MPTPSTAPLLDARQLAQHLNVTVGFVHRITCERKIPRRKLGHRTIRYDLDAVLSALSKDDEPPPVPAAPPPKAIPRDAATVVTDLPSYDWSTPTPAGATLPPADRRG